MKGSLLPLSVAALLGGVAACDSAPSQSRPQPPPLFADLTCSIPEEDILDGGVGLDGIPSIEDPVWVAPGDPAAAYLDPRDRVIGMVLDGQPVAIPHNVLWWHEIVNLELNSGERLAVTYCPLTGSSMVFDRSPVEGASLGVSGLLFRSNLIMYDRRDGTSLWPQMEQGARCGPEDGTALPMVAALELNWDAWWSFHPETVVLGADQGFARNYQVYPYGNYEELDNAQTLVPLGPLDTRRPPKERVLGIPGFGGRGIAFPFLALDDLGAVAAVHAEGGGESVVVLWNRFARSAMAYRAEVDGEPVTFRVEEGRIRDSSTDSAWRVDGVAVDGPLEGVRLTPIDEAYVAFWFAWADFHPETSLWLP